MAGLTVFLHLAIGMEVMLISSMALSAEAMAANPGVAIHSDAIMSQHHPIGMMRREVSVRNMPVNLPASAPETYVSVSVRNIPVSDRIDEQSRLQQRRASLEQVDSKPVRERPIAIAADNSPSLQAWFEKHGVSEQVQHLRTPSSQDGDGAAGNIQWPYFETKCMQRRQEAVAREILNRGCEHVVEVGGYVSPVDGILRKLVSNTNRKLPKSYINIDPSVKTPKDTTNLGMRSMHVPMCIADFTSPSAEPFRQAFQLRQLANSTTGICAVMLSVWDPHVATSRDRDALRVLLGHVSFLAASAANDEMTHLRVVESIAKNAHDLQPVHETQVFDCSKELEHEQSHYAGDEIENLDFLAQKGSKQSKLSLMSWRPAAVF